MSLTAGAGLVVAASLVALPAPGAGAYPYADVTLQVHGFGGGTGMGQWGALGYALVGSTYTDILQHYYGTLAGGQTTAIDVPAGWSDTTTIVSVALTQNADGDNQDVIVTSPAAFTAGGVSVAAGGAARFQQVGAGSNSWDVNVANDCGGDESGGPAWGSTVATVTSPTAVPGGAEPFPGNVAGTALTLCYVGGTLTVRGNIEATLNTLGQARALNTLPLGQYVADVTPSESPASWGALGTPGPQGEN
ncbi:MAG: hypothetical protein ACRDY1_09385, partial [Acidimicrobiales bacterium]